MFPDSTSPTLPDSFLAAAGRFLILRLSVAIFIPGLGALGVLAILGTGTTGMAAALACLCAGTGLAVASLAPRLAHILAKPAGALAAIGQFSNGDAPSAKALRAQLDAVEQKALRAMQDGKSRLNELQRARDTAQAESLSRSTFMSSVGHELRTPLNAIIGYAMLLSEDMAERGEAEVARDIDRILISSRRLLRLINNILDFSRQDSGAVTLERAALDVREVTALVAAESGLDTCPLQASVSPAAAVMIGDKTKLRQALMCLLGASTTDASSNVHLTVDADPAHGDRINFALSGDGLSLAALRDALDVDKPLITVTPAALAASVVRRLAILLDGTIEIRVENGRAAAILSLPRNAGAADAEPTEALPTVSVQIAAPTGGRRVLVIDDDADTIALMERWLSGKGYQVLSAASGSDGLARARAERPDFIILDIFMPGQSGYDVLKELRADPVLKAIPVIIASSDDNRAMGLEAGAAEVLVKPLSPTRLGDVIAALGERINGNILVVDDEADAGELVRRYGNMAGMTVRVATSIEEGLTAARTERPDAIVLDLCFPGRDGFAMMEMLAGDEALCDIPVMILSQLDLSPEQHMRINMAGHHFHPKWRTSPSEIVANIKTLVAQ